MQEINSLDEVQHDCVLKPRVDLLANSVKEERELLLDAIDTCVGSDLLLDITSCKTIDSQGVSLVVGVYKECKRRQKAVQIVVKSPLIVKVFQMMQLDKMLDLKKMV